MLIDKKLIDEARQCLGECGWRDRDRLEKAIDLYEVACLLSNGKDPSRSDHWSVKAFDARYELRCLVRRVLGSSTVEEVSGEHSFSQECAGV